MQPFLGQVKAALAGPVCNALHPSPVKPPGFHQLLAQLEQAMALEV